MDLRQLPIISLTLLLFLGVTGAGPAIAQDPVVDSATPSSAIQGTLDLNVEIAGSNFGRGAVVRFLESCTPPDPCVEVDARGVAVGNPKVKGSTKIEVKVNISEDAYVGDIDIQVELKGRKGKGTTLFKVQASTKPKGGFSLNDITVEYTGLAWEEAFQPGDPDFPPGWENWTDNTLDSIPRPCFINVHLVDPPTAGRYDCDYEDAIGGRISIDLAEIKELYGITWVAVDSGNKTLPYPEFCDLLNRWDEFPRNDAKLPLEFGTYWYKINFLEGCTDSDCHIGISHQSFNGEVSRRGGEIQLHPFYDLSLSRLPVGMEALPDIGRLIVKSGATGVPAPNDNNAFTQSQTLVIEGLEIRFGSPKNGAILADCKTEPGTVGGVVLKTCPDPFECED